MLGLNLSKSLKDIAKYSKKDVSEIINILDAAGIIITDTNSSLSEKQIEKINLLIQKENKNLNNGNDLLKRAEDKLENLIKDYVIFLDTCSLMHYNFKIFSERIDPLLNKYNKKVIIPIKVVQELKKFSLVDGSEKSESAKKALKILEIMNGKQLIDFRGESTDNFADNVFMTVFSKHRLNHRLLLITQDVDLAKDILNLNNIKSSKGHKTLVNKITKFGYLGNFVLEDCYEKENYITYDKEIPKEESFQLKTELYTIKNEFINITSIPDSDDYVFCNNKKIKLIKCIASGGEGSVYETDTSYICKIYKKEKLKKRKFEKIKLMVSKKINYEGICWPIDLVYNEFKEFVGYLMPKAFGKELQKCLFIKPLLLKNFPQWKKRNTVELCITILEKIQFLHERNIILGDINPMNILVVSSKEVYFVDTDSYQVEGFPCPVGTVNYTAPEIQRKNFDTFLRSFGNEYFAVSTLLFMIMLPGKPPYSQQGGESPIENIIKMDFSYPLGEESNKKAPEGPWRYMWSHMPYYMKEKFYTTFRKNEKYSTEEFRLSTKEWQRKMKRYLELLDSGKLKEQDEMSVELFPTRYKKNIKKTYIKCNLCGQDVDEEYCEEGICKECLSKGEIYTCSKCGEKMIFSNYARYIKKARRYEICRECYEELNDVLEYRNCIECGKIFAINNSEYEFYMSKGLELPKRCEDCRKNSKSFLNDFYNLEY